MIRFRYRRILFFFARVISSIIFWDLILSRLGLRSIARRTRPQRLQKIAVAYRALAVEMGGVLIKVGQFLSTRVDVLPSEITNELSGLQDEVPPVPFPEIRRVAEAELGKPLEESFEEFEHQPLAAASLGQVHRARLDADIRLENAVEDFNVVVKIQRPDIEQIIQIDLAALRTVSRWIERYPPIRKRVNLPALLDEFSKILYEEIDYLAEGQNAEKFAENFSDQPEVLVPKVVWSHTTRRTLSLENVLAIKITDYEAITQAGVSRAEVASRLLNTYLQQIFEDGFFHADPHPGNLFVKPLNEAIPDSEPNGSRPWQLTFVDFGMVGTLDPHIKAGLREMLIGVGTRDSERVVASYEMLGVLLPDADLELIQQAEAKAFDRFWGMDMAELTEIGLDEMKEFAREYRQIVYEMPFQVPKNIIFLARAVGILSGMCSGLNPNFNVWDHLAPFARRLIAEEAIGQREFWINELGRFARALYSVPIKMDTVLNKFERGEIGVKTPELNRQAQRLDHSLRLVSAAIVFASLLLGGVQLYLSGYTAFAAVLLAGSFIAIVWILLSGR